MFTPIFLPIEIDASPSWCEKHNCQCPCHDKKTALDFMLNRYWLVTIAGLILLLAIVTITSILCDWLILDKYPTLWEAVKASGRFWWSHVKSIW
jgi:hypothetical protein